MNHYDIIIIGTGAGGGTLAYQLAPSGKKILILERGEFLPREKDNWSSKSVFVDAKYQADETWYDKSGSPFHPGIHYFVGGNTKFYGAALFRLRKEDFGEIKHKDGISPAWPLSYEEFEPFYSKAEQLYHVHGKSGLDPTEPQRSSPYPYPPVSHEPRIQELEEEFKKAGCRPFPLPLGILLKEENGKPIPESPCIRCSTCDGFPCLVNAKADSHIIGINTALTYPNVTLLTHAYVSKLETDPSGKTVKAAHVERNGELETYSADIIVVSCGAINSALLLLRSANETHPNGLANSSGVVGRHYMRHTNSAFMAVSAKPNLTIFQKTLALTDFYFGSKDWEYPMGSIQMLGKSDGEMIRAEASGWRGILTRMAPELALEEMAEHAIDFWLTTEDLPLTENRVELTRDGKVALHLKETNLEEHERLTEKLKSLLTQSGCKTELLRHALYMGQKIPIAGTAHQCGTIRFGTDPKTSALDLNCRAHDLDNLYVVDGSFMVSSGAVNPSLTIMANALRVGEHLLKRTS